MAGQAKIRLLLELKNKIKTGLDNAKAYVNDNEIRAGFSRPFF